MRRHGFIMKMIVIFMTTCTCTVSILAQSFAIKTPNSLIIETKRTQKGILPLSIGDKVPQILLKNIYNYRSTTAKISDFEGKLLLLDFWATSCLSCIEGFPKMQALQTKYNDQIQVILVNAYYGDDENKVKKFFERRKVHTGQTYYLPYTLQDSILLSYFPLQFIPHYVWIDKTGTVVGITSQTEVTESNIKDILDGKKVMMKRKNDNLVYNTEMPILINGNGGDATDFQFRTIITGYKEGLGASIGNKSEENGKISKFYVINYPVFHLYQMAYNDVLKYPPNRTFIEVTNPDKFALKKDGDKDENQNKYCYETIMPPITTSEALQYMRDDLYRFFHAIAKNETREMEVYSLVGNAKSRKLITKGGKAEIDTYELSLNKHLRNRPVSEFIEMLNYLLDKPVIDKTGIMQNIDVTFPYDFFKQDQKQLKFFLSSIGFELIPEKQKLEVAVISNK